MYRKIDSSIVCLAASWNSGHFLTGLFSEILTTWESSKFYKWMACLARAWVFPKLVPVLGFELALSLFLKMFSNEMGIHLMEQLFFPPVI